MSTCHWCHVMEEESFTDAKVAELLNKHFVSIKVDREERPDVDHVYMNACIAISGDGGWPLTAFLTAERKPFFAGTYFPKENKYGKPGFTSLLNSIVNHWNSDREKLFDAADAITQNINEKHDEALAASIDEYITQETAEALIQAYDKEYGGFGNAPKFPSAHNLMFLMRSSQDVMSDAWKVVKGTLDAIARGGLRDHIGGGFCRYSTDRRWLVPHFEKMTYDNALLCMAYTECWQKTRDDSYSEIVNEIICFISREMTELNLGGFYAAQDADSEGIEGKFYLWTPTEIINALGEQDGKRFCEIYDISERGNFEKSNIPNLIKKQPNKAELKELQEQKEILYHVRQSRVAPSLDKKVLLTSTSLMICALAKAGRAFNNEEYTKAAARAAQFILQNMQTEDGRFFAVWIDAIPGKPATLDGYAYFVWALIELYTTQHRSFWLEKAMEINNSMIRLFSGDNGGLYYTGHDIVDLPARSINAHDGAVPSGQSVAARNQIWLSRLTGDEDLEKNAVSIIESIASELTKSPTGYCWMMTALQHLHDGGTDVIIADGEGLDEMLAILNGFYPFLTISINDHDIDMVKLAPHLKNSKSIDKKATAYVCSHQSCYPPTMDYSELENLLQKQTEEVTV